MRLEQTSRSCKLEENLHKVQDDFLFAVKVVSSCRLGSYRWWRRAFRVEKIATSFRGIKPLNMAEKSSKLLRRLADRCSERPVYTPVAKSKYSN